MVATLPIGRGRRLIVILTRRTGLRVGVSHPDPGVPGGEWDGGDDDALGGVREPRRPRPPGRGGAAIADAEQ